MKIRKFCLYFLAFVLLNSCVSPNQKFSKIPPGIWRGVLYLDNPVIDVKDKDEITIGADHTGEVPFNFEVVYDNEQDFHIIIHNADERIKVTDINFGRKKSYAKDTLAIFFNQYDTYIDALFEENVIEGYWHVNYRKDYKIRFKAFHGQDARFKQASNKKMENFNGRFDLVFSEASPDQYAGIGDFTQSGEKLVGTILTETGDYRFLEGKVFGNKALLSCFDGAHAFLIELKKEVDGKILGEFRSGTHHKESFSGIQNAGAKLSDGFHLVKIKNKQAFNFKKLDAIGKLFDTHSAQYKGRPKIYEVMGTWCPNCMDATNWLKEVTAKNKDVVVAALAYERYKDSTKVADVLNKYIKKTALPYPLIHAGYYDKKEASLTLPQIDGLRAYPTLIFVDRNDIIKYVYSGFYGPATKEHKAFVADLESKLNEIVHAK